MGFVHANTEITNVVGDGGCYCASFLVDTGAIDTVIPANELDNIGVARKKKRSYELANGSRVSYDVGYALVRINGEEVAANVIFGDNDTEPLLGVTVLESAGFVVDPVNQVLKKVDALSLK
jgi:clan AA aspartic protease